MKLSKKFTLLQEIMQLAVAISQSKTNPADIFVNYSGHVNEVTVYGYTKGYRATYGAGGFDINYGFYLHDARVMDELSKVKTYLTELLAK
jgi:hypothetical protein